VSYSLKVGRHELIESAFEPDDDDPRGFVHVWELPDTRANYVISCDPSYGRAGWQRALRTEDDEKTDNCAIEVLRCGHGRGPDVQVAEYAAPIDAEDAAAVVNLLGKMYAGRGEDNEALVIIEVQPGPGLLTQRELINRFGYSNLFIWQHLDQMAMKPTLSYGWYSTRQSRQALWIRGTRHINQQKIKLASPWLIEEMTDCVLDNFLSFTARAQWGAHDDRVVALLMGIWCVPPDTEITLSSGSYVPISSVKPGDNVLSRDGVDQVKGVYIRHKREPLREFSISGSYIPLRCTVDHKILIRRTPERRGNRKSRNRSGGPLEWVAARDISVGHQALVPARFDLPKSRFTPDQLYLMGWYLAEGFLHENTIYLSLGPTEINEARHLSHILDTWLQQQKPYRGSKRIRSRIVRKRTTLLIRASSPLIAGILREYLGTGSHEKALNAELFNSSGLEPLLRGWLEGDGHIRKGQTRITTVSQTLAKQMRQVFLNHRVWAKIEERFVADRLLEGRVLPPSRSWIVHVGMPWVESLYDGVPYQNLRYQRVSIVPEGFLTPITKIKEVNYAGFVYDLETEHHTFAAAGVVIHNCANEWNFENAPEEKAKPTRTDTPDYQKAAISYEDMYSDWSDRTANMD
jgi:hypothetical protein